MLQGDGKDGHRRIAVKLERKFAAPLGEVENFCSGRSMNLSERTGSKLGEMIAGKTLW